MQDAQLANQRNQQARQLEPALPFRSHTILGVCEGLGEDLGIPPVLLRLVFAGAIFWNPGIAVGAYLGLGLIVLAARLLFPAQRRAPAPQVEAVSERREEQDEQQELQLAA